VSIQRPTLPLVAATPELQQYVTQYNALKATRHETRASLASQRDALLETTIRLEEKSQETTHLEASDAPAPEWQQQYNAMKTAYRQTKALLRSQKDAMFELENKMQLAEARLEQKAALLRATLDQKKPSRDDGCREPITPKDAFISLPPDTVQFVSSGSSYTSGSVWGEFELDDFRSDSKGKHDSN
jgi:hypothetical protein